MNHEPADLSAEQVRAITARVAREYQEPSTRLSVRGEDEHRLDPARLLMRLPVWLRYALLGIVAAGLVWGVYDWGRP